MSNRSLGTSKLCKPPGRAPGLRPDICTFVSELRVTQTNKFVTTNERHFISKLIGQLCCSVTWLLLLLSLISVPYIRLKGRRRRNWTAAWVDPCQLSWGEAHLKFIQIGCTIVHKLQSQPQFLSLFAEVCLHYKSSYLTAVCGLKLATKLTLL